MTDFVDYQCQVCGATRTLRSVEYHQRMERSASGELFCSQTCANKRKAVRGLTGRGVFRINIQDGGE